MATGAARAFDAAGTRPRPDYAAKPVRSGALRAANKAPIAKLRARFGAVGRDGNDVSQTRAASMVFVSLAISRGIAQETENCGKVIRAEPQAPRRFQHDA